MSTLRYSGQIQIRVTYIERVAPCNGSDNGQYRCFLRSGTETATVYVGAPAYLSHSVDSPEAFDDAAHAAISVADDDGWGEFASTTRTGWHIGRRPGNAYPAPTGAPVLGLPAPETK